MGVKLVRMPHGCMDPKKVCGGWWKKIPVLLTLERKALKAAGLTYVTCDAEAKWMRPWVGKIVNIPLGVDFSENELPSFNTHTSSLAQMGAKASKWVRANFDWQKNVRRLMEELA